MSSEELEKLTRPATAEEAQNGHNDTWEGDPIGIAIQPWVGGLPLVKQGDLFMALRGPDGKPRNFGTRNMLKCLRGAIAVHNQSGVWAYTDGVRLNEFWQQYTDEFLSVVDACDVHFLSHFMAAVNVLCDHHPSQDTKDRWLKFKVGVSFALEPLTSWRDED